MSNAPILLHKPKPVRTLCLNFVFRCVKFPQKFSGTAECFNVNDHNRILLLEVFIESIPPNEPFYFVGSKLYY